MYQAWFKSITLQVTLWCFPYAKDNYFLWLETYMEFVSAVLSLSVLGIVILGMGFSAAFGLACTYFNRYCIASMFW